MIIVVNGLLDWEVHQSHDEYMLELEQGRVKLRIYNGKWVTVLSIDEIHDFDYIESGELSPYQECLLVRAMLENKRWTCY